MKFKFNLDPNKSIEENQKDLENAAKGFNETNEGKLDQLKQLQEKEKENNFKQTFDKVNENINIKSDYKEDVIKLAGITTDDDEKAINDKLTKFSQDKKYENWIEQQDDDNQSGAGTSEIANQFENLETETEKQVKVFF